MQYSPQVIWFTGLSGSGKTTLAKALKQQLEQNNRVYLLDGDTLRDGLNSDLGFSIDDRTENIRRAAHIAKLWLEEGYIVIASFITPMHTQQALARSILSDYSFTEVYLSTPLAVCQRRDPKQLYQKARVNKLIEMTGDKSPYQEPLSPEAILNTDGRTIEGCIQALLKALS